MKATHFSALSMCPRATFALGDVTEMICHCFPDAQIHAVHPPTMKEKRRYIREHFSQFFQRTVAIDDRVRRDNQRRLRELKKEHGDVRVFCAHSKAELDHMMRGAS